MKFINKLFETKNKHTKTNKNNQLESMNVLKSLKSNLSENIKFIKTAIGESSDIVIRELRAGEDGKTKIGIIILTINFILVGLKFIK